MGGGGGGQDLLREKRGRGSLGRERGRQKRKWAGHKEGILT